MQGPGTLLKFSGLQRARACWGILSKVENKLLHSSSLRWRMKYDVCQDSLGWVLEETHSTSSNTIPAHMPGNLKGSQLCLGPGARKGSAVSPGHGTSSSATWSIWSSRPSGGSVSGGKRCSKDLTASPSGRITTWGPGVPDKGQSFAAFSFWGTYPRVLLGLHGHGMFDSGVSSGHEYTTAHRDLNSIRPSKS